ncbi:hypothetical protein XF_2652 [Xylella fastidiosa 9a5c]|uniref:Uncharacterized protein n=1 Tax=Xylella fastidiosa (strain 9a5c) TaxID=160492 RepID=Q9PA68_XYLFA|nr:hypothetical protein XF_2652 [Xylella fastidiosa 9a5c]
MGKTATEATTRSAVFGHHATLYQHSCQDHFKHDINTPTTRQKQSLDPATPTTINTRHNATCALTSDRTPS